MNTLRRWWTLILFGFTDVLEAGSQVQAKGLFYFLRDEARGIHASDMHSILIPERTQLHAH